MNTVTQTNEYMTVIYSPQQMSIVLSPLGIETLGEISGTDSAWDDYDKRIREFEDMFESIAVNGGPGYRPNLGSDGYGLTDADGFILGCRADDGSWEYGVSIWYDNNYQIRSFVDSLADGETVYFVGMVQNGMSATKPPFKDGQLLWNERPTDKDKKRMLVFWATGYGYIPFCSHKDADDETLDFLVDDVLKFFNFFYGDDWKVNDDCEVLAYESEDAIDWLQNFAPVTHWLYWYDGDFSCYPIEDDDEQGSIPDNDETPLPDNLTQPF